MVASDSSASFGVSIIAGGVAGGVEAFATYPFEFAKTRYQLHEKASGVHIHNNPFLAVRDIIRKDGLASMYKGCSSLVIGSIGKDAIRFVAFDSIKRRYGNPDTGKLSTLGNLGAGMAAGLIASTTVVTPSERIKTALIDDGRRANPQFRSPMHAISTILARHGPLGLYHGYVGTTLKQTGATAFRLGSYHIMKDLYAAWGVKQSGAALDLATGAAAGLITTLATQPFDVIKTRSQSAEGSSTVRAVRGVVADYGLRGFWRGTTMRLGRTVFSGAILFSVYEQVVKVMDAVTGVAPVPQERAKEKQL